MSTANVRLGLEPASYKQITRMLAELGPRARFAASIGMNRTANEIQDKIRAGLPQRFTLRRADFVAKTIYRKPGEDFASKDRLVAGVRIQEDRDFLAKFEKGGVKTPRTGRFLAIPQGGVRRNKNEIVPRSQGVRALIEKGKAFIKDGAVFQRIGRGKGRRPILAYLFRRSVKIPATLDFVETARKVSDERLAANIIGAIQKEFSEGLTSSNGPSR